MEPKKLSDLKDFIQQCKADPSILTHPSLSFFTDYLHSFGSKLPQSAYRSKGNKAEAYEVDDSDEDDMDEVEEIGEAKYEMVDQDEEEAIVESDVEFEGETVEPDNDPPQKMGDLLLRLARKIAMLLKKPRGRRWHEKFFEMCTINPDSAKGHKSRGMARAMLGQWKEAAKDLHVVSNIDYDEEISALLKKVEPNANKIEEHQRKYDRLHKEREDRKAESERQRHKAEAQAAYEKAKKQEKASSRMPGGFPGGMSGGFPGGMPGGFPGGMPGAGGVPGGMPGTGGMPGGFDYSRIFNAIYNDPEMMAAMKNPEFIAALQDVTKDSANFEKHEQNPRVGPMLTKMFNLYRGI